MLQQPQWLEITSPRLPEERGVFLLHLSGDSKIDLLLLKASSDVMEKSLTGCQVLEIKKLLLISRNPKINFYFSPVRVHLKRRVSASLYVHLDTKKAPVSR